MTIPATPLLLYDNVFDTAVAYPAATLTASAEIDGAEAFRVGDGRRDRTWWQPPTDGGGTDHYLRVNLGSVGARAVDFLVLDRGSNLWGKTVYLEGGPDGATWNVSQAINVPALNTIGGTPTMAAAAGTEEGVVWSLAAAPLAARLWWQLRIPYTAAFIPIVTGLMVGSRTQLLGYSNTFDEDAGERTQSTQLSTAGYRGAARTYSWRTCELALSAIGATEYDGTIRAARAAFFERAIPAMIFLDYVTRPERGWLYELDGATWSMAKSRVHRDGRLPFRELGPRAL